MTLPSIQISRRRGAALVVVLLFVVLLTVLVVAFFMKATSFRGLSQSSVNEFKTDTLARSALNLTVADLRQEIRNGSDVVALDNRSLFVPKTAASVVPARSGNPPPNSDGTDAVPNLVRRSVRSDAIATPGVPSRASASSSLDPSRNSKYISAARWNKHYLIPRDPAKYTDPATVGTDPISSFEVPDWVYVTTKGPQILTSSTTSVVGRYAYAIYDEGGLLDINVAGYPESTPLKTADADSTVGKVWGSGNKGGATAADLTVLGLTQAQINQLIGWRSFASSQPGGTFPNLTYDADSAKRYFASTHPHQKAFLSVPDTQITSGGQTRTDQTFTSRQQLLKFRSLVGFPQDALQYLGTFSRDLEQPSFIPNPNRPRVRSAANTNVAKYGTGNDAFGADRGADPAADINPPFPRVRVKTAFTPRRDGTPAVVGEPLVKKRFPLSRLGQVLQTATAAQDPTDPIYRDFGLYRANSSDPWKYDHGNSSGILRLDEVASLNREPDFFELLKAGINVGSLGKSAAVTGWTDNGAANQLQHDGRDIFASLQLLQIGANIIDQYDHDGYPTRIAFAADLDKEVRGVESLPYLHRIRFRYVQGVTVPASGPTAASNPGSIMIIPEVWNPHGSAMTTAGPMRFRVRAESTLGAGMPTSCKLTYAGPGAPTDVKYIDWATIGTLEFSAGNSTEFNEPVVLSNPGLYSVVGKTRTDTLTTPSSSVTGLVAFDFDRYYNGVTSNPVNDCYMGEPDSGPVSLILEYWNGSSFVPYDRMIVQWRNSKFAPKEDTASSPPKSWVRFPSKGVRAEFARTDPRSPRWGGIAWGLLGLVEPIDAAAMKFPTSWPSLDKPPFGPKDSGPLDSGFSNAFSNYPNNDLFPNHESRHRGFTQGYWSQNIVQNQLGFFGVGNKPFFNRDPDGIARRAMGAYSADSSAGGSATNTVGLPLITGNSASRPVVLNRPFRSVAELGYTFRDSPWKNLDFSFPESGDAALLDVFCIDETQNDDALVAGRVNLNTRQMPVLKALLAGSITDDMKSSPGSLDVAAAEALAKKLIERTTSTLAGKGPVASRADLVGRWTGTGATPSTTDLADPDASFSGFSSELGTVDGIKNTSVAFIPAQREAAIRSLSDAGTARTWNLLIDLVAQSGRFANEGASLDTFQAEGEKRYWLHVAIDRLTGEVIDQEFEVVTE